MNDASIEIQPGDVELASFDVVIDIGTDGSIRRPFPDAVVTSYDELTVHPERFVDPEARILVVCDRGVSSRTAAVALRSRGYMNAVSLIGGARGTDGLGGGGSRYDRQIRLVGFGAKGQAALEVATITVVGAGGLGCPALSVLAPAGVGTIRIVDFDTVDLSNLHRQPLFTPADVGAPKVKVAAERLRELNPDTTIEPMEALVTRENASSLIHGSTVVIDATDTFSSRVAITEASVAAKIPMVYGSIYGFEGQFAIFDPPNGPCYRCVFPSSPAPGTAIDCSTVGTLGAVTAVIGALEASAAIQLAAGIGSELTGTLTMFDARTNAFDRLPISRDPACEVCGHLA
jgi:sulfur-carrier protein adenylyltransferase/sulfurtransferase